VLDGSQPDRQVLFVSGLAPRSKRAGVHVRYNYQPLCIECPRFSRTVPRADNVQ
jgi:hypothetical protein